MDVDCAEEFTAALETIGDGWFRQLAIGIKLGVPEAMGLSRRQWSDRIGVSIRSTVERRVAVGELAAEGLSNRAIADIIGVAESTVRGDKTARNRAPEPVELEEEPTNAARNRARVPALDSREAAAAIDTIRRITDGSFSWVFDKGDRSDGVKLLASFKADWPLHDKAIRHCGGYPGLRRITELARSAPQPGVIGALAEFVLFLPECDWLVGKVTDLAGADTKGDGRPQRRKGGSARA